MNETHVVTCFLRNRGEVLLRRRSDDVGSSPGQWEAVSGHVEGDSDAAARREIREEAGLDTAVSLVRTGDSFAVEDADLDTRWVVHPFLYECESRAVEPNDETVAFEWVSPTAIRRRETVPDLWRSYEHVAPTLETTRDDTDHGSAWISIRALEVLRDRAGVIATTTDGETDWTTLANFAEDLRVARPSMTVLKTRIDRSMADASDDRTPAAVERAAIRGIERAFETDTAAARAAAHFLRGTVLTLSRSGTVLDALRRSNADVLVIESRPAREGVGVAEELVDDRVVTLAVDAAAAHVLTTQSIECVVVGADTVLPNGSVLNKVGTRGVAIAAAHEDVPVYAVAANDKISTDVEADFENGDRTAVYNGDDDIDVVNPTFDCTPPEFVTVLTEDGPLDSDAIASRVDAHRSLGSWAKDTSPNRE